MGHFPMNRLDCMGLGRFGLSNENPPDLPLSLSVGRSRDETVDVVEDNRESATSLSRPGRYRLGGVILRGTLETPKPVRFQS